MPKITPPSKFLCALTNEIMHDPVRYNGIAYERKHIEEHLLKNDTRSYFNPFLYLTPLSKESISRELIADDNLRGEIQAFLKNDVCTREGFWQAVERSDDFEFDLAIKLMEAHSKGDLVSREEFRKKIKELRLDKEQKILQLNYLESYLEGQDILGNTLLHFAVGKRFTKIIQLLLDAGMDVNLRNRAGRTPLHVAVTYDQCYTENVATLNLLLSAKQPDVNAKDKDGMTPLHLAADYHRGSDLVQLLIAAKADVNPTDNKGRTPLHIAACNEAGNEIVPQLIAAKADASAKDKKGKTPLHKAAKNRCDKSTEIMKLLLEANANVNEKDIRGETPLHRAAYLRKRNLPTFKWSESAIKVTISNIKVLLEKGALNNILNKEGKAPSVLAIDSGYPEIAELILRYPQQIKSAGIQALEEIEKLRATVSQLEKVVYKLLATSIIQTPGAIKVLEKNLQRNDKITEMQEQSIDHLETESHLLFEQVAKLQTAVSSMQIAIPNKKQQPLSFFRTSLSQHGRNSNTEVAESEVLEQNTSRLRSFSC